MKENKVARDLYRFWDRKRAAKNTSLNEAAENIATIYQQEEQPELPGIVEYTSLSGAFVDLLAGSNVKASFIGTDNDTIEWLTSDETEGKINSFTFEEPISIEEPGFILCPNEDGWQMVIIRDVLLELENDDHLISILNVINKTMCTNGRLVLTVQDIKQGSRTEEIEGVLFCEKIEKERPRVFNHVFSVKSDDEGYRTERKILAWAASDLHYCAKNAGFRPVSGHGLNPLDFCVYERV